MRPAGRGKVDQMATKELVTKVWIEEGCIVCDACETTAPTVFEVLEDTCIVRPAALEAEFTKPLTQDIIDAAEECPVDVIKFETAPFEVAEEVVAAADAAEASAGADAPEAPAQKPAAAAKPAHAAKAAASGAAKDQAKTAATAKAPAPPASEEIGDPAMQALLRAARSRGGNAAIARRAGGVSSPLDSKDPDELPPDARFAKTLDAAKKSKEALTRREVMSSSAAAMGLGWGLFATTSVGSVVAFQRFMMPNALEEPDPRVRVGPVSKYMEMAPGEVNEDFKPRGIWMIRTEDRIAALNIICTHLGCIPNWLANDRKFLCPCHGSGYYYTGINFQGPTPRPLERFRLSVVDGIVVVDKSKKFQYELGQWANPESFIAV
ncbi:MAG: hypothetical protein C4547_16120 [Phycisphaerales bacterium]|nr:MAG: hypothetical protein C4547_16120 [Phycisphaerales bacterium]